MKIKTFLILLTLFLLSVVIRIPTLNRPLSDHHEWLTAHLLLTMRIWREKGINTYYFSPVYTFTNVADKYINSEALGGIRDNIGNYYYVSYPPFSFIFPFFLFKVFNITPDILPLQIINLIIHFINAYFIYKIIALLGNYKNNAGIHKPALIGYVIYLFSPNTAWFHSNIYSEEILAQLFWILLIYLVLALCLQHKEHSLVYKIVYFLLVFLLIYTDWTSIVLLIPISLLFLYRLLKKRCYFTWILITITASLLPIILTVYQYSLINGYNAFLNSASEKFLKRSGYSTTSRSDFGLNIRNPQSYKLIINNYKTGYFYVLIFLSFTAVIYFSLNNRWDILQNNRYRLFILLALTPVIIHHILFFNFTVIHDFSALKSAIFISVICAILYDEIVRLFDKNGMTRKIFMTQLIFVFLIVLSIRQFYNLNSPARDYSSRKKFGEAIAEAAGKNNVVFVSGELTFMEPQVMFYAGRNIIPVTNDQDIYSFLKKYSQNQAIEVVTKPNWKIEKIKKIDVKNEYN